MQKERWQGLSVGAAALAASAYHAVELRGIGFPDGHRTALDRFHERALPPFALAFALLGLAALASTSRPRPGGRAPLALVIALVALVLLRVALSIWAAGVYEHGAGGLDPGNGAGAARADALAGLRDR